MRNSYFAALAALALGACGQSSTPSDDGGIPTVSRENAAGLTQTYAEFRATQVGDVRYQLAVDLDPELDHFS
ncbi:MAG: hypothetical protein QNK34_16445, partial [Woeseiaceae bacterium]|nr:hypothetical protein [Woeseiaceae bacterium]MDX2413545.1 hypothetical protein [Woeseiaceae bacterium]